MDKKKLRFEKEFNEFVSPEDFIEAENEFLLIRATLHHDYACHIDDDDVHNEEIAASQEEKEQMRQARDLWLKNHWFYGGICIDVFLKTKEKHVIVDSNITSVWGIQCNYPGSDNKYLREIANDILENSINLINEKIKNLQSFFEKNQNNLQLE